MELPMRIRYVLAYFLPVLAFLLLDQSLGREYFSFPTDNIQGWFGMSLNLPFGDTIANVHPANTFILFHSLLILTVIGQETLDTFYWLGFGLNISYAIIASFLVARFSSILRLPIYVPFALSLMVMSMPTIALYAPMFGAYFPMGILAPAMALGLYVLAISASTRRRDATIILAMIGFFTANLFLIMPIVVGAIVGFSWLGHKEGLNGFLARLSPVPKTRSWLMAMFIFVVLVVLSKEALDIVRHVGGYYEIVRFSSDMAWAIASVMALSFVFLVFKLSIAWRVWWALMAPMVIGWALSCHILILHWGDAAGHSMLVKGMAADPSQPFTEVMAKADFWGYLSAWAWHWFPIVAVVLMLIVVAVGLRRKDVGIPSGFAVIFVTVSLSLTFLMAANVSFLNPTDDPMRYGQMSRYIIMSIVVVAFIITMIGHSAHRLVRLGGVAVVLLVCGFSFNDYVAAAKAVMPVFNDAEEKLQLAVDRHLSQDPKNNVVCVLAPQPRPCAALYGYNNYRMPKSLAAYPKKSVRNGRILHAFSFAKACVDPENCGSHTLFVGDLPDEGPDNRKIKKVIHFPFAGRPMINAFKLVSQ